MATAASFRRRWAGLALVATLGLMPLAGCSLFGLDKPEPVACPGESAPEQGPAKSSPLLTIATGQTPWALDLVVYRNGNVAIGPASPLAADSANASAPAPWQSGYILPCALTKLRSIAQDAMLGSPDFGKVALTDQDWTYLGYDNGALRADAKIYGLNAGITKGLDWSERRARDDIHELMDFLDANIVTTDKTLAVRSVQVDAQDADRPKKGWPAVKGWPGPKMDKLLGKNGCKVTTKKRAQDIYTFASSKKFDAETSQYAVRVLPPRVKGCQ